MRGSRNSPIATPRRACWKSRRPRPRRGGRPATGCTGSATGHRPAPARARAGGGRRSRRGQRQRAGFTGTRVHLPGIYRPPREGPGAGAGSQPRRSGQHPRPAPLRRRGPVGGRFGGRALSQGGAGHHPDRGRLSAALCRAPAHRAADRAGAGDQGRPRRRRRIPMPSCGRWRSARPSRCATPPRPIPPARSIWRSRSCATASDRARRSPCASATSARACGYQDQTRYLAFEPGWGAALTPGVFALAPDQAFWIKVIYDPKDTVPGAGHGERVIGLYSTAPAMAAK